MSFSVPAKAHYACLAMLELAVHHSGGRPLALREIVRRHGIPQPFLTQILQQLKSAGYVSSTRGPQGGYRLAIDPSTVSLLDICDAVGCRETDTLPDCGRSTPEASVLESTWQSAGKAFRDVLSSVHLDHLVREYEDSGNAMFYI